MFFFPLISTKTAITLGAIVGASVAILNNKDDLLLVAADCLHKGADQLNALGNKRKIQCPQRSYTGRDEKSKENNVENDHSLSAVESCDNSFMEVTTHSHNLSETDITTPETSDSEFLPDYEEEAVNELVPYSQLNSHGGT